jgi:hypothetical protein
MKKKERTSRYQPLARAAEVTLFWLPVFAPLVLLSQLGTKGLRPALSESKRLEQIETQLHEKHALAINRHSELNEGLEASGDLIYRERVMKRRRREAMLNIESSIQSEGLPVRRR